MNVATTWLGEHAAPDLMYQMRCKLEAKVHHHAILGMHARMHVFKLASPDHLQVRAAQLKDPMRQPCFVYVEAMGVPNSTNGNQWSGKIKKAWDLGKERGAYCSAVLCHCAVSCYMRGLMVAS